MKFRCLFAAAAAALTLSTCAGAVSLEQVQPVMPQIDLFVHSEELPLDTLELQDISAALDGVPLEVNSLQMSQEGIFYVFMLDISRSISEPYLDAAKQAVLSTYRSMGQEDELALISFGNEVNILLRGGESAAQVEAALDAVHSTDNNTCFYDAMNTLVETASSRQDMRRVAVVVSDGVDDTDAGMTQQELESILRQSGVAVYALAVDSASEESRAHFRDFIQVSGGDLYAFSPANASEKLDELQLCIDEIWHLRMTAPSNVADGQEHALCVQFGELDTFTTQIRPTQWIPDDKPPYPISVKPDRNANTVAVQFSEPMANTAEGSCYVLKDASGKAAEFTVLSSDAAGAVLHCPSMTDPMGWTLELSGLTDASMEANALAPCSLPVMQSAEQTPPTSTEASGLQESARAELTRMLLIAGGIAAAVVAAVAALVFSRRRKASAPKAAKAEKSSPRSNKKNPGGVTFYFESEAGKNTSGDPSHDTDSK